LLIFELVPNYTTEYEDAYRDPAAELQELRRHDDKKEEIINWKGLGLPLNKLIEDKFEVDLARKALEEVRESKFGFNIEEAYEHFKSMQDCKELSEDVRVLLKQFVCTIDELKAKNLA
jgi:hypothetical protein